MIDCQLEAVFEIPSEKGRPVYTAIFSHSLVDLLQNTFQHNGSLPVNAYSFQC